MQTVNPKPRQPSNHPQYNSNQLSNIKVYESEYLYGLQKPILPDYYKDNTMQQSDSQSSEPSQDPLTAFIQKFVGLLEFKILSIHFNHLKYSSSISFKPIYQSVNQVYKQDSSQFLPLISFNPEFNQPDSPCFKYFPHQSNSITSIPNVTASTDFQTQQFNPTTKQTRTNLVKQQHHCSINVASPENKKGCNIFPFTLWPQRRKVQNLAKINYVNSQSHLPNQQSLTSSRSLPSLTPMIDRKQGRKCIFDEKRLQNRKKQENVMRVRNQYFGIEKTHPLQTYKTGNNFPRPSSLFEKSNTQITNNRNFMINRVPTQQPHFQQKQQEKEIEKMQKTSSRVKFQKNSHSNRHSYIEVTQKWTVEETKRKCQSSSSKQKIKVLSNDKNYWPKKII